MSEIKDLVPVLAVTAGWLLNELGQRIRLRREDRKAIGRALSELLEVHYQVCTYSEYVGTMERSFGDLPPVLYQAISQVFGELSGQADLGKRYNEAVTLVSSVDPVLGFRLRSRDNYSKIVPGLKAFLRNGSQESSLLRDLEPLLETRAQKSLEELLRELAWQHGIVTWVRVWRRLRKNHTAAPYPELDDFMRRMASLKGALKGIDPSSLPTDVENALAQFGISSPSKKP